MKKNRVLTTIVYIASSIGGLSVDASAAVISVNYDTATSSTPAMLASNVAGVIPVANWNNVVNRDHSITFGNDSGNATSLGVSVSGGGIDSWNRGISDPVTGRIFSDKITMGAVGTINLTTVPYAIFDVYVYLSDWGSEVIDFSIDGGATTLATLSNSSSGFDGSYLLNNNYVKLSGLTGSPTIRMTRTSGEVHLAAFQIVQIPEPDAALFGGLGMLALLRRRRA